MGFLNHRKSNTGRFDRFNHELGPIHLRGAMIANCVIDYPLCSGNGRFAIEGAVIDMP